MSPTTVSIKISDPDKVRFKLAARREGISMSRLFKDGADLREGFSSYFWERLNNFAEMLGCRKSLVLENMLISRMAREIGRQEVFGVSDPLDEFSFTSQGPVTGEELFKQLHKKYSAEFQEEYDLLQADENQLNKSKAGK